MKKTNKMIQNRTDMLRARSNRCVCKFCGGNLRLRRILFSDLDEARIELFCSDCDRIELGVEPEIRTAAKLFVEQSGFNCFPDLEVNETTKQMNISKVSEIISWGMQHTGMLDENGFSYPVDSNTDYIEDSITVTDDDIADFKSLQIEKKAGENNDN